MAREELLMARVARKRDVLEAEAGRVRPRTASEIDAPHHSPARSLQDELTLRLAAPAEVQKWSARRTLAFITLASGAGWSIIAGAIVLALH